MPRRFRRLEAGWYRINRIVVLVVARNGGGSSHAENVTDMDGLE